MQTTLELPHFPPRFIVDIIPDGEEEAQCIRVAHPSRLYITDDYIPTHNSEDSRSHWRRARDAVLEKLRGDYQKPVTVETRDKNSITISFGGLRHALNLGVPKPHKSLLALHIQEAIRNSTLAGTEPDRQGRPDPATTSTYRTEASIDGNPYQIDIVARDHSDGKRYYDHFVITQKSPKNQQGSSEVVSSSPRPSFDGLSLTIGELDGLVNAKDAPRYSVDSLAGDSGRDYSAGQRETFARVGREVVTPTFRERVSAYWQDIGQRLRQGVFDQFAPLKALDEPAYRLARLSRGADGALEAMLLYGRVFLNGGVYDVDAKDGGVVDKLLKPLGREVDDFMWWIAGHRAERLSKEEREHLMTAEDIENLKSLSSGTLDFDYTLQGGPGRGTTTRSRQAAYEDAQRVLNAFNRSVLDVAEQSGLIDGEERKSWESDFYVPFYREAEENERGGRKAFPNVKKGLVRQKAFERLKGGREKLRPDLLANTLLNWSHLLDASARNRAAKASLEAAERAGVATRIEGREKGDVFFRENGKEIHYTVDDPFVMDAVSALEFAGLSGAANRTLGTFKRYLTIGVTANPAFKVRNLIRDSISSIGQSELSYNLMKNLKQGWRASDKDSQTYVSLLAGGGVIRFGTMIEGNSADRVRRLVAKGVDPATIIDSGNKLASFYRKRVEPLIDAYNELGDRSESVNRAALYEQLRKKGLSHAEASFAARDLMDFSMGGTFTAVRFLAQTVPFFNARLQGLYKLGRASRENPRRMGAVVGATALFSLLLLGMYHDDDDWKKREDWDRDTYWWFKFGGVAYRIPKPFEIGAMATLAERSAELLFDKEMDGRRFGRRLYQLLAEQLSMNPTPQLVKPLLDLYANKDSFTGRAIETMDMERRRKADRFNGRTSEVAKLFGQAGALSPVQIDHLIRGYFGWLGTAATTVVDEIARAPEENARPDRRLRDWFLVGNFVETLPAGGSRYVTQMYEQAREVEEAYASWRHYLKTGETEKARALREANREKIARYRRVENLKRAIAALSARERRVETDRALDGGQKRAALERIAQQKDRAARTAFSP